MMQSKKSYRYAGLCITLLYVSNSRLYFHRFVRLIDLKVWNSFFFALDTLQVSSFVHTSSASADDDFNPRPVIGN